uniref:Ubiquitin carboxyl-terminal hydrolase n=1 Tax=Paramormyrops kingsleyae TaxID=1676925 RepID=A0A3B3REF3_9TELE|nr:ubiquitin carboxyl-terminal hydrolase 16 isoform X1 [Paramormyrops kingsleyae]XP_023681864.1 ubiquitin carboxyl-terminal hydrolase 16 isoform X1 [Paramormyrops kingsleyae]
MGKKRKEKRDDENFDHIGSSCTHIRKGIDKNFLKKTSQLLKWNTCQDCGDESGAEQAMVEDEEDQESAGAPMIWVCLRCGHRGCGRTSENQHAIKHYEKPHSDTHCLVLALENWNVWCYLCDDEVQYSSTGQLAQLVSNVKKQAVLEPSRSAAQKKVTEESRVSEAELPASVENSATEIKTGTQRKGGRRDGGDRNGQKPIAGSAGSSVSVRGLSNLGNTCFFNAVVQNLSQTRLFRKVLKDILDGKPTVSITPGISTKLEPISIQLEQPGSLTVAMSNLLNEIQETEKSVITPRDLFTQVCKKAARFKGFQQQDSQELLRYLLDGMRAEETKRYSLGISAALKNSGKDTESEELKKQIKDYEKNGAPKNFVDQVFGGELTSTVMCKECKTVSLVTEIFLDLSLPVSDEAYRKKNQKKVTQKPNEDRKPDSPMPAAHRDEDALSGVGSKYQQKKAKKQAKKQAKNQRRQQKLAGKTLFTGEDLPEPKEGEGGALQREGGEPEAEELGDEPEEPGNSEGTEEQLESDAPPGGAVLEPETVTMSSAKNPFEALSEDPDMGEENEDGGEANEGDDLAEDLHSLSLNTAFVNPDDVELDLEDGDPPVNTQEYTVVNQDPGMAFSSLASRAAPEKEECSIYSCLYQFTEVENLTKSNSLLCVTCSKRQTNPADGSRKKVYTDGLKQMLVSLPPPVLTLHLKRFQQVGYSVCKVNRHVHFPQILDLAPFCSVNCKGLTLDSQNLAEGERHVPYALYGVVEHSGTMRSGHYTAYVKARLPDQSTTMNGLTTRGDPQPEKGSWYHVSDTSIQPVPESKVQSSQAYLLFYERIS